MSKVIVQGSHTPFGNVSGAQGIGKISCVLTKSGNFDIVLMYEVSIARLIPKMLGAFTVYEIKMGNKKKKKK